jgi:hypothetical protein
MKGLHRDYGKVFQGFFVGKGFVWILLALGQQVLYASPRVESVIRGVEVNRSPFLNRAFITIKISFRLSFIVQALRVPYCCMFEA